MHSEGPSPPADNSAVLCRTKRNSLAIESAFFVPKKVQFGTLESARLCLRTEKSYLAIASSATAGRSVSGAARSSLLPAKVLDALGTTKE